jgi:hypothetical protein
VSHGRYVAFQLAEVAIRRNQFAGIERLIAEHCLLAAPMSVCRPRPFLWKPLN